MSNDVHICFRFVFVTAAASVPPGAGVGGRGNRGHCKIRQDCRFDRKVSAKGSKLELRWVPTSLPTGP
eukprot:1812895-Pyramimonas_sp.AAC.2